MEVRVPKRKVDLVLGWPFPMHPSSLLTISTELQQTKAVCFISPVTSTQAIDKVRQIRHIMTLIVLVVLI